VSLIRWSMSVAMGRIIAPKTAYVTPESGLNYAFAACL
jgi:hypothetical protein